MTKNYRADQIGHPFTRVRDIRIQYQESGDAIVACTEQEAVRLADGSVRSLGDQGIFEFTIKADQMGEKVPVVNPATGEPVGQDVALQSVMLGIASVIRSRQLQRDQAAAA